MRTVRDIPVLENIPVLLRTSLNVPVENGKVVNDFRLEHALPTINYLRERSAKVVLVSHITGTGTETLFPMYEAMKKWVPSLAWCPVSVGKEAREAIRALPPGGVVMLENLRRNKGEEKNDPEFVKELAALGDVFVQDSFDVCHREHASVVGVTGFLPSYAGYTVEAEVTALSKALTPKHPSLAIIGGAKFSTKEPVLKKLLSVYDYVFVGGALANDFLKAKGYPVGSSLVSGADETEIQTLLSSEKLVLQADSIVAPPEGIRADARVAVVADIHEEEAVLDIGPTTTATVVELINKAKTILWNGPMGLYEHGFTDGTRMVAQAVVNAKATAYIGGGDTIAAIEETGVHTHDAFLSTGGGAMLDFLAYGNLPGLQALK